ncbi:MAG: GIY-YIG nuclease family protein [Gammaproteobacteria bacterium]
MSSENSESWYIYIIETGQGTLYTGISKDVEKRFREHVKQGQQCAKYLKGKTPLTLVFQMMVNSKSEALRKEYEIKQLSTTEKRTLIKRRSFNP